VNEADWTLVFSARARRDLRRLDPPVRARVIAALERLAAGDRTVEERKLKALGESRLRVGDWRVRFTRDAEARVIGVTHVLPRGRAYER
jgi:mRNA interferase RelE/StbE